MTRGSQRERDRERAAKKASKQPKEKKSGQALQTKKLNDAEIMRQKQKDAEAKRAAQAAGGGTVKS